jgi:hypothetical protein
MLAGQITTRPNPRVRTPTISPITNSKTAPNTDEYKRPRGPKKNVSTSAAPTDLSFTAAAGGDRGGGEGIGLTRWLALTGRGTVVA